MGKGLGAKDRQLTEQSPVLAVMGIGADHVGDRLTTGQALQRVLLTAHAHGLQASYLNQPIQVESLRPELRSLLGQDGFPQIVLRLGFPADTPPATPRRSLDEVIQQKGDGSI
jgi:hypothetical protein